MTDSDHTAAANLLRDLGVLLVEAAREARANRGADDFGRGRAMAYYEVVSLLSQQAAAFGLSADQVGLAGVDPERDLI